MKCQQEEWIIEFINAVECYRYLRKMTVVFESRMDGKSAFRVNTIIMP